MFVKGAVAVILLVEAVATLVPLAVSQFSMWLEDHVSANRNVSALSRFVNQLNLVPTRPASLIWLSLKYHFQPSVPTGGLLPMFQAAMFYLIFNTIFFVVGSYMYKLALEIGFRRPMLATGISDCYWAFFGTRCTSFVFGLFILFVSVSSALSLYPLKVLGGLAALLYLVLRLLGNPVGRLRHPPLSHSLSRNGWTGTDGVRVRSAVLAVQPAAVSPAGCAPAGARTESVEPIPARRWPHTRHRLYERR
jgi:hypothetical protein